MRTLDRKGKIICVLTLIPVLAVMATIFYFSSQTAEASTVTSGGFVEVVMGYITKIAGDISADAYTGLEHTVAFLVRKAAHFLEFAALGFFLMLHLNTFLKKKAWLWSGAVSVLYAVSDEAHQHFVSERAPRFLDVCVDSFGAVCGIILILVIILIYRKIKNKRTGENAL